MGDTASSVPFRPLGTGLKGSACPSILDRGGFVYNLGLVPLPLDTGLHLQAILSLTLWGAAIRAGLEGDPCGRKRASLRYWCGIRSRSLLSA